MASSPRPEPSALGPVAGAAAYALWGLLPLYLATIGHVPPLEILAHRVVWSLVLMLLIVTLLRRWPALIQAARRPLVLRALVATSALIACNWLIYIWAVLNHHVMAASLGYFINPLVNVALGVLLLKERLRPAQMVAVALAAIGVALLAVGGGWWILVSLGLALSFGFYGLIRKVTPVDSLGGLTIETAILGPVSLAYLVWMGSAGAFGTDAATNWLLAASGIVTATPLLLFGIAAPRMRYTTLGLLQYIAPTLQFLQAVLVFGEKMNPLQMATFAFIWSGLAVYAVDGVRAARRPAAV